MNNRIGKATAHGMGSNLGSVVESFLFQINSPVSYEINKNKFKNKYNSSIVKVVSAFGTSSNLGSRSIKFYMLLVRRRSKSDKTHFIKLSNVKRHFLHFSFVHYTRKKIDRIFCHQTCQKNHSDAHFN